MESKTSPRETRQKIAKKIRFLLHNHSITINQMAERIGIASGFLREVVDGDATPTRHMLTKVCSTFNLSMDFFGTEVEEMAAASERPQEESERDEMSRLDFSLEAKRYAPGVPAGKPQLQTGGGRPQLQTGGGKPAVFGKKKKKKGQVSDLALHYQALLECLIEKKLLNPETYQMKLLEVRKRAKDSVK